MYGVDYAWERPNLDTLWNTIVPGTTPQQRPRFVSRYLAYNGTNGYAKNGKVLTRSELIALHTRGFAVMLNWEQAAGDMFQGYNKGVEHAREALRQATALGAPSYIPIYFSCDKDTTEETRRLVAAYLYGCADVLGRQRVGVYGEADVINAMLPAHAAWGWQTYAWSGGAVSSEAHVLQYKNGVPFAGITLDLNRTLQTNFGAWFPNSAQVEVIDMDAQQSQRLTNTDQTLYALGQLDRTADAVNIGGKTTQPLPLVDLLIELRDKVRTLSTAGIDAVALAEAVATRVIAADTNPLTDADKAVIVAAVKDALRQGTE